MSEVFINEKEAEVAETEEKNVIVIEKNTTYLYVISAHGSRRLKRKTELSIPERKDLMLLNELYVEHIKLNKQATKHGIEIKSLIDNLTTKLEPIVATTVEEEQLEDLGEREVYYITSGNKRRLIKLKECGAQKNDIMFMRA